MAGLFFCPFIICMRTKPDVCRVHTFFDGQNLLKAAEKAFGYNFPNFDPFKLSQQITALEPGRTLETIHFYTGIHDAAENRFWYNFWTNKLNALKRHGAHVVTRVLKYSEQPVEISPGQFKKVRIGREKGIDVRIALDLVRLARLQKYDVAVIFSQDQDLAEAVAEVKEISQELQRWIRIESAFPVGKGKLGRRGIDGTQWRIIDKSLYDLCIDSTDYRPKQQKP
jgi:uncharacterized LabA/DUF88 family protein